MRDIETIDGGDVIVVGAGLAGAFAVWRLTGAGTPARAPRVTWVATRTQGAGSSAYAQGGIAVALGADDTPDLHRADTIAAGAGIVDDAAARVLTEQGPDLVRELAALGVPFDRDALGAIALGREAAHGRRRIAHAGGDATGARIMATLAPLAAARPGVTVLSGAVAESLMMAQGRARGLVIRRDGARVAIRAPAILLATGGIGALYRVTTNPPEATGEGLGLAARAGAVIADPEFVQFHPTAIDVGRDPAPLATEALRGEGAWLIDETGARFCLDAHPDGELAPRDVVARAIWARIGQGHTVFLDTRAALGPAIETRFPTVFAAAMAAGIDPRVAPLPVRPAAHYHMGGIAVDLDARTSLPGLWAAGEVAATGVHGANRLASNSLLEALVTGDRAARSILGARDALGGRGLLGGQPEIAGPLGGPVDASSTERLRAILTRGGGGLRDAAGLTAALDDLDALEARAEPSASLANRLACARLILSAALNRRESRGAHARADHPETAPEGRRTFLTLSEVGAPTRALAAAGR